MDTSDLNHSLTYLKIPELRELCALYSIPDNGKKNVLIERIIHFSVTGKVLPAEEIPVNSRAKKGELYPLHPEALIVKGAYKNDLKTRIFMKSLVGPHFHFTAAGIDWIHERWMKGCPPTYREFADFWKKDHQARRISKPAPKKEWAYINYVQRYLEEKPHASKKEITDAWNTEREKQVKIAKSLLSQLISNRD